MLEVFRFCNRCHGVFCVHHSYNEHSIGVGLRLIGIEMKVPCYAASVELVYTN